MNKVEELKGIIGRLRGPGGCPWDQEQTHGSLMNNFIEEAEEVVEAVEKEDWKNLEEELGDILLHVMLQSEIGKEEGRFSFDSIVERLCEKLIRRHPHVFGEAKVETREELAKQWDEIKKEEKGDGEGDKPKRLSSILYGMWAIKKAKKVMKEEEIEKYINNGEESEYGKFVFRVIMEAEEEGVDLEGEVRGIGRGLMEEVRKKGGVDR